MIKVNYFKIVEKLKVEGCYAPYWYAKKQLSDIAKRKRIKYRSYSRNGSTLWAIQYKTAMQQGIELEKLINK